MATIEERVIEVTAKTVNVDKGEIKAETRFVEDLGLDSMDVVELIINMEEEFGSDDKQVEISDEDAQNFQKVQDVVDYLKGQGITD